jgi:1-phosphatidylinositol-5-phosphate 4-kinase
MKSLTKAPKPMSPPGGRGGGAKFYASQDHMYMIKTLNPEEVEQMHLLLKNYHPYVVERHGRTLLPQYLGLYRVTVDNVDHYMVVIRNIFSNRLRIHTKYNLKGSTVDREASMKERAKDQPTYKDNDFLQDGIKIHIGQEAKTTVMETLNEDLPFLAKLHIMDYSLLLGVHSVDAAEEENLLNPKEQDGDDEDQDDENEDDYEYDSGGSGLAAALTPPDSPPFLDPEQQAVGSVIDQERDIYAIVSKSSSSKREIYFLALADILTTYGVKKQAAKVAKTVKYGSNVEGISTIEPEQYASRFLEFISNAME